MKTKLILVIIGCVLMSYGCGIRIRNAKVTLKSDAVQGTYNFAKASAFCEYMTCMDDCGGQFPAHSYDWQWIKVPDGADAPEFIKMGVSYGEENVAFIPTKAGQYEVSVEVTCSGDESYAVGTVEETFWVDETDLLLKSTRMLDQETSKIIENKKKSFENKLKKYFSNAMFWYIDDFNGDGQNEILLYTNLVYEGGYGWKMVSEEMKEMFKLTDESTPNKSMYILNSILGVGHSADGEIFIYVEAKDGLGAKHIITYQLDYENQTLTRIAESEKLTGLLTALNMDIDDNGSVELIIKDSDLLECQRTVYSLSDDGTKISALGGINLCDKALLISVYDENDDGIKEAIYKMDDKYFVYER